jgi:hypothetical protein
VEQITAVFLDSEPAEANHNSEISGLKNAASPVILCAMLSTLLSMQLQRISWVEQG